MDDNQRIGPSGEAFEIVQQFQSESPVEVSTAEAHRLAFIIDKKLDELKAGKKRAEDAYFQTSHDVEQALGKVLDYPELYPHVSKIDDGSVCVGDHVPATIAAEAANKIKDLKEGGEAVIRYLQAISGLNPEADIESILMIAYHHFRPNLLRQQNNEDEGV